MRHNPLHRMVGFGQSIWLDFAGRAMLISGELVALIQEDGVSGVTSNFASLEKVYEDSSYYQAAVRTLTAEGMSAEEIYERILVDDVRLIADLLRPMYDLKEGRDGFACIDISPRLAHDTQGTLLEARRLWERVERPNVMIRLPGTSAGVSSLRQLTREGINVNVTPLFSISRYRAVADAYLDALAERAARGLQMERIASVAGFYPARIDARIDATLTSVAHGEGRQAQMAAALRGEAGIAVAKAARKLSREILSDDRYLALAARGARPQRLLWASTGIRHPSYQDLRYFEALIGPESVHSAPLDTLAAYREHGIPAPRLDQGLQEAAGVLTRLQEVGVDLDAVSLQMEEEGLDDLTRAFASLMSCVERKRAGVLQSAERGDGEGAVPED
jgi:transaldolase